MKKKKIRLIICIIVLLLVVAGIVVLKLVQTDDKKNKDEKNTIVENSNKDVVSDKEVSNILFSNIKYNYDGTRTKVSMSVTNKNNKSVKIGIFNVKVYDVDKKLIDEFHPIVSYILLENNTGDISFSIKKDLSNADSIEFDLPNLEFVETQPKEEVE